MLTKCLKSYLCSDNLDEDETKASSYHKRLTSKKQVDREDLASDPMIHIVPECHDLIFQHFRYQHMKVLKMVSQIWARSVEASTELLNKSRFVLTPENKDVLMNTPRRYWHIKAKQDVLNNDPEFLKVLIIFLPTLKSLSFEGSFDDCINTFFEELEALNDANILSNLEHLTLFGDVTNIELFLSRFTSIKGRSSSIKRKEFKSIELIALRCEVFWSIFKHLRSQTLVLRSMNIRNVSRNDLVYMKSVKQLRLISSKIDRESAEALRQYFYDLGVLEIDNFNSLPDRVRQVFKDGSIRSMEILNLPTPTLDDFMVHLPEAIHSLIFQHLICEDLTKLSTVSKTFFNFTSKAVAKTATYNSFSSNQTRRCYENVNTTISHDIICMSKVHSFVPWLKELYLEVQGDSIQNVSIMFSQRNFPLLTTLSIACHQKSVLDNIKFPTTIETLHLSNFIFAPDMPELTPFYRFLEQAVNLVELQFFDTTGIENLFKNDLSANFPFNLKALKLQIQNDDFEIHENIDLFLKRQSKSLQKLILHKADVKTIKMIVERCNLTMFGLWHVRESEEDLIDCTDQMENLNEIQLPIVKNANVLKHFLKFGVNVKVVHVYVLSDKLLDYLRNVCKSLEEIRFFKPRRHSSFVKAGTYYEGIKLIGNDTSYLE